MKLYHLVLLFLIIIIVFIVQPVPLPLPTGVDSVAVGALTLFGDGFHSMNQTGIASSCYSYALSFNETDTQILHKKGDALYKMGEYDEAAEIFQSAAALDPTNPVFLVGQGRALLKAGDTAGAEASFNKALEVSPEDPAALHTRAVSLLSQGRYTEAIRDLDRLVEENPESAKARMYRGDAYLFITTKYEAEMRDMKGSKDIMGSGTRLSSEASGAYQKASMDYMKAMELDPFLTPVITAKMMAQYQSQAETYGMILQSL
ncbi:MAG: tetratricopeptide repeat protein [Methanocalculus sp.]|uniref:tetratricopeptide repeat protein n=1 Tax=Methanocalculus sp. TaxID=2004547 RepID=UPI002720336D|nr:tetratricopeptide repeat protein [Methanocalculus sp.]MDO9540606.1 tetratricopeptide repeat protein [Methanocalculus sp.]